MYVFFSSNELILCNGWTIYFMALSPNFPECNLNIEVLL